MTQFHITRIQTGAGIFRLTGELSPTLHDYEITYSKVEMMGTDGWCELDLHSSQIKASLTAIKSTVLAHLIS
ncbi:hypothetical protein FLM44_20900 [Pseudoalteromonas luteoviolacea]|nr:hypothetical protein FLM44_20900 [Pseudoalteromonas luteoviolacea]